MANLGVTVVLLVFIGGFCAHVTSIGIIDTPANAVFKLDEENVNILNCTVAPADEDKVEALEWKFGEETICKKDGGCSNAKYEFAPKTSNLVAIKTTYDIAGKYTCKITLPSSTTTAATMPDASVTTPNGAATTPDGAATTMDSTATTTDSTATTAEAPTITTEAPTTETEAPTTTTEEPTTTTEEPTTTSVAYFNGEAILADCSDSDCSYPAEVNIIGKTNCPETIKMTKYETRDATCSVEYAGNIAPALQLDPHNDTEIFYFRGREAAFGHPRHHKRSVETVQGSMRKVSTSLKLDRPEIGTYKYFCKATYYGLHYEDEGCPFTVKVENAAPLVTPGLGLILATLLSTLYQRLM